MVYPVPTGAQQGKLFTRQLTYRMLALLRQPTLGAAAGVGLACVVGGASLTVQPAQRSLVALPGQASCGSCDLLPRSRIRL